MPPSPDVENGRLARTLYEQGMATGEILNRTGLSTRQLYNWLDGGPPDRQRKRLPAIPRRARGADGEPGHKTRISRAALVNRLWRAAERHAADIERRLTAAKIDEKTRERDARTLAILARTVRELVAIDAKREEAEAAAQGTPEDDELPRDLDALRDALASRIEHLRAERLAGILKLPDAP